MRSRLAIAAALALAACGAAQAPRPAHAPPAARAPDAPPGEGDASALDELVARAREDARVVDVPLEAARGALAVTGEAAVDDRVAEASVAARVGGAAAVLVTTACGNVWLVGMRFGAGRWSPTGRFGIVADARPGGCRTSHASAASCAMTAREPREVVVTFASESEEGAEARDPALRLFHLAPDGRLEAIGAEVAFGGTDDATGAIREGQWAVEEALDIPRDLYVQIQPGRPGPGGTAPPFVVRRTYRVQGHSLVLVEETSQRWRPRLRAN